MEFLIGRDSKTSRLLIVIDGAKKAMYGNLNSVPMSVSREHCRIVKTNDTYEVFNCNEENSTYVKGLEVDRKLFDPTKDLVELGPEKYKLNILEIINAIIPPAKPRQQQPEVKTYSIAHLEGVWDRYHDAKLSMQIKERKSAALRSVTGIFSMSAVACGFMPGIADIVALRVVLYGLGFSLMIYFFIVSYRSSGKNPKILDDLDKQLHRDYICPNPKCRHFMSYQPYADLKRRENCPHCRSNFVSDK